MKFSILIILTVILYSCSPSGVSYKESNNIQKKKHNTKHTYKIFAKDINGQPISGAKIIASYKLLNIFEQDTTVSTNDSGFAIITIPSTPSVYKRYSKILHSTIYYGSKYNSSISYKITKEGYYIAFGNDEQESTLFSDQDEYIALDFSISSAMLIKPIDYFADEFLNSSIYIDMKDRVLGFIDILLLQSILQNAQLETKSIKSSLFKKHHYFSLSLTSGNVYNSLKLSKYDIGKKLFDEIVRKILNPLNDNLSLVDELYGYDLVINSYSKSFADKKAANTKIVYRFYIPKDIVAKYKNKDISGQQLLDSSIILMDDERVDFKLQ